MNDRHDGRKRGDRNKGEFPVVYFVHSEAGMRVRREKFINGNEAQMVARNYAKY